MTDQGFINELFAEPIEYEEELAEALHIDNPDYQYRDRLIQLRNKMKAEIRAKINSPFVGERIYRNPGVYEKMFTVEKVLELLIGKEIERDGREEMKDKPILCGDCAVGGKPPKDFKPEKGEYCPCCVHHD